MKKMELTPEALEARRAYNREVARRYRERHRARVNANARKWRVENPEKVAVIEQRYWEKKAKEMQQKKAAEIQEKKKLEK